MPRPVEPKDAYFINRYISSSTNLQIFNFRNAVTDQTLNAGGNIQIEINKSPMLLLDLDSHTLSFTLTPSGSGGSVNAIKDGVLPWREIRLWINGVLIDQIIDQHILQCLYAKHWRSKDWYASEGLLTRGMHATPASRSKTYSIPLSELLGYFKAEAGFILTDYHSKYMIEFINANPSDYVFFDSTGTPACSVSNMAITHDAIVPDEGLYNYAKTMYQTVGHEIVFNTFDVVRVSVDTQKKTFSHNVYMSSLVGYIFVPQVEGLNSDVSELTFLNGDANGYFTDFITNIDGKQYPSISINLSTQSGEAFKSTSKLLDVIVPLENHNIDSYFTTTYSTTDNMYGRLLDPNIYNSTIEGIKASNVSHSLSPSATLASAKVGFVIYYYQKYVMIKSTGTTVSK